MINFGSLLHETLTLYAYCMYVYLFFFLGEKVHTFYWILNENSDSQNIKIYQKKIGNSPILYTGQVKVQLYTIIISSWKYI